MFKVLGTLVIVVALPVISAQAGVIIVNGGFETGDFTGWTSTGWFTDSDIPNSGSYYAGTGCTGANCTVVGNASSAYLFQDVATTPGTSYALSFFYNSGGTPTLASTLRVLWGDPKAALSQIVIFTNVNTLGAYVGYSGTVTASSATSRLEFLGRQDPDFYQLDDVALAAVTTPPSVPEPSSGTLILVALIALVWTGHRGRKAAGDRP